LKAAILQCSVQASLIPHSYTEHPASRCLTQVFKVVAVTRTTYNKNEAIIHLEPVLDHTRIIKYHTLKYVRIVKNIKYAYDTRIITQVGRKDTVHTEGLHNEASVPRGGVALPNKVGSSRQTRKIAVLRQEFEEKSVSSKLVVRAYFDLSKLFRFCVKVSWLKSSELEPCTDGKYRATI